MKFYRKEIPIANSMLELIEQAQHPFQKYFCFWAAFNNIYTLVGERQGLTPSFDLDRNQQRKTEQRWTYTFPKIKVPKEHEQISEAINHLYEPTKESLITHPNIPFFIERTPKGVNSKFDVAGQEINGVLNVNRTVNLQSPVWSPISRQEYEKFVAGDHSGQDILTEQIVFMLYAIRNNLLHGSKSPREENDVIVVENALPLLELLVLSFIRG